MRQAARFLRAADLRHGRSTDIGLDTEILQSSRHVVPDWILALLALAVATVWVLLSVSDAMPARSTCHEE